MNKFLKWIIGLIIIVVVLIIVFKKSGKKQGIIVTADSVAYRTIVETVNGSGKLYPELEVKVSPDVSGEIIELYVEEGDSVKKGQVLAKIYPDIYKTQRDQVLANLSQAQAQLNNTQASIAGLEATLTNAQNTFERQKKLLAEKVISQAEFDNAKQSLEVAQANLKAANQSLVSNKAFITGVEAQLNRATKDLSRTTLLCPMNGVISLLNVKKGERVVGTAQFTGTEMMRVADLSQIEVRVDIGENDITKVKIGDTALVEIDAFDNRKFKGVVKKIANPNLTSTTSGNSNSTEVTNYLVHIRLLLSDYADLIKSNRRFPFRPNMTVDADIQTQIKTNVLSVPLSAVTTREKSLDKNSAQAQSSNNSENLEEIVFAITDKNFTKKTKVKTGIQDLNFIEIVSGLNLNQKIVTGPYFEVSKNLQDSVLIKVEKNLFNTNNK